MSFLARCRLSSRWLVLLVGFATLAVMSAAVVPHGDGTVEDRDCLVCKAGQKPLTELSVELGSEPPVGSAAVPPESGVSRAPVEFVESGAPRAPPA